MPVLFFSNSITESQPTVWEIIISVEQFMTKETDLIPESKEEKS